MELRSVSKQEEQRKKVASMTGVGHFGTNVSTYVDTAMSQGGSLAEDSRRLMYGKIKSGGVSGKQLSDVVPGFVAQHIETHQGMATDVHQVDLRVGARKSESYIGHQVTSTRVNSAHGSLSSEKEIPKPMSPYPYGEEPGSYHQTHASPFNLVGAQSNGAHTVWAPGWANITVDGHMEKRAAKAASKGHSVYHFRVDTDTQSTVGYVKQRSGSTKKEEFKAFAATYERR